MNSLAKPGFAEGPRQFCGWMLISLLAAGCLSAVPVYEGLNHVGLGSCFSSTDAMSWLWLAGAFPLGFVCVAIHYIAPGPGRGKGWLTHILAAEFGLVTLGWLGLRFWWYGEMVGNQGSAIESIWWLSWLCN